MESDLEVMLKEKTVVLVFGKEHCKPEVHGKYIMSHETRDRLREMQISYLVTNFMTFGCFVRVAEVDAVIVKLAFDNIVPHNFIK